MNPENEPSFIDRMPSWVLSNIISGQRVLVLAGLLVVALNLRPAITSVSPVIGQIRMDLGLSSAAVSLLITLPMVCMGVCALTTDTIARWLGRERTVFWGVVLVGVATTARFFSSYVAVLFATAVLVGIGIALIQALLPALVEKYFPDRVALVTGLYTTSLLGGAAIAAGATAPLANVFGSWQAPLAFWGLLAIVAAIVWRLVVRGEPSTMIDGLDGDESNEETVTLSALPWRSWWGWILALFYGGASFLYFAMITWLAPLYQSLGWSEELSGALLTVFTVAEIGGTLGVIILSDRYPDRRPALVVTLLGCVVGYGAIALVPLTHPWLWVVVSGIGQGGLFNLALVLPVDYAPTPNATGQVSSMVFGVGYLLASIGPVVVGWLHDFLGGYEVSFLVLGGISIVMLGASLRFRPGDEIKNI